MQVHPCWVITIISVVLSSSFYFISVHALSVLCLIMSVNVCWGRGLRVCVVFYAALCYV